MKIGLLSDTHGYLDQKLFTFFKNCDEIWHAGDIGNIDILRRLEEFKPVKAVFGNIDGSEIRSHIPREQRLNRAEMDIYMIHIGGYPGRYEAEVRKKIMSNPPDLFISGHSHILKIIADKKHGFLHINPGSSGYQGFHEVRTAVRLDIIKGRPRNLEIIELGSRSEY